MSRVLVALAATVLTASLASAQDVQIFQIRPGGPGDFQGPPVPPSGSQTPARDTPAKTGTATIRGRVLAADNGQALRKAQVRASSPDVRENRLVTTDVDGRYEVKELPAGRYTITAAKGSYVSLSFGQLRPFEPGKPLDVREGQTIEKVDFFLPRGGVLTGRVLDEYGDPASDVAVQVMRSQFVQGQRRLIPAGRGAMTDDIGGFRIFGLSPGQYYVSATLRPGIGPGIGAGIGPGIGQVLIGDIARTADDRSGYAPTYYPGTPNVAEAQRITLDVGQAISDLVMTLAPVRLATVSGTAIDSAGRPFAGAMIMVGESRGLGMMVGPGSQVRADGSFTVNGLAPGEYTLQVFRSPAPFGPPGLIGPAGAARTDDSESATAAISVNGSDISDVYLVGMRPSTVTGRIVAASVSNTAQSLRPSTLAVQLVPAELGPLMGPPSRGAVRDDFTFEAQARPGRVRVNLAPLPAGWAVKAVRHRGDDVTDTGLDVRPNEDVEGLDIEMTDQIITVTGVVTGAGRAAVKDYSVVVFARDADRWAFPRYQRMARPDQDGRFKITGLPPGSYDAIALDYVDPGEVNDPELLGRLKANATGFSVGDGETKQLDLRLSSIP